MTALQYALVAYVRDPVGGFVEDLRHQLLPEHGHLPAHITVLPPRLLQCSEEIAIEALRRVIAPAQSFEVEMGEVENFLPTTPTVFLRVSRAAYRLRELHDELNLGCLYCPEQWTYMPHMTVVKMPDLDLAVAAMETAREQWSAYRGPRSVVIDRLSFVREAQGQRWLDLAEVRLTSPVAALPR